MAQQDIKMNFEKTVQAYVDAFCKKHDTDLEFWVASIPGTVGQFGDSFIDFENIRYDIDNDVPKEAIWQWYSDELDNYLDKKPGINFSTFCQMNTLKA